MDLVAEKRSLRHRLRETRTALAPEEIARRSAAACARLLALGEGLSATTVAVYAASAALGEIDPSAFARAAADAGALVCYPLVREGPLSFHLASLAELQPGTRGIREPSAHTTAVPLETIDLIVVPGVAFDAERRRLGMGAGYYDRTLPFVRGLKVGFAFDFQVVPAVPHGETDVPVDVVVTDLRVLR